MNLSLKWLSDYVKLENVTPKEYSDRMTDTGSKVEGFEVLSDKIENVVVGKLISVEKHPDSDHLLICQVDVGKGEPVQIITGAQNVKPGEYVPAALHNSLLPDGTKIKAGKLRGLPSNGMLCSLGELGLSKHEFPYAAEDGIWLIKDEGQNFKVGDDIKKVCGYDDTVVEFEITPNRPDCLSVLGLARESAVSYGKTFTPHKPVVKGSGDGDNIKNYIDVEIKVPDTCYRYTSRAVKNVKVGPSPLWLRERLWASGVRPINNIVDITNFVCLEYGQPMHAFDKEFLKSGKIIVRNAAKGEKIVTLDGVERELEERMMVIADGERPVAVAGVMGGENSEITDGTTTVIFESAAFSGPSVRITARDLGLRTEASGRYEKGLDAENTLPALERACELVELLGCGTVVDGEIDVYPTKREIPEIPFDAAKINAFLGTDIPESFMLDTLAALSIEYRDGKLIPPSFRADIVEMPDIAEEVARIWGYNKIEATRFKGEAVNGGRNDKQKFLAKIAGMLVDKGLYEIQTYSFISPKAYDKIRLAPDSALRDSIVISNPLGEDTSIMRTTALANVLEVLSFNRRQRASEAAVFEMAKVYRKEEGNKLANEKMTTVITTYGKGDFYSLKGLCENVFAVAGIDVSDSDYTVTALKDDPSYHPGRCAVIKKGDDVIAILGQIHPKVAANFGFDVTVYAAEIDVDKLFADRRTEKQYTSLPKFPATTRDLAFVCDDALEAGTLAAAIKKYGGSVLESVKVFDVFKSDRLGFGKKSMAYSLTLRAKDRTLSDTDADSAVGKILAGLEKDFGVTLRG